MLCLFSMDWYSWLSKSNLAPSNVYDYTLLFIQNEIEEEDAVHFNHEFLKSMGISIAKHRLEILKLATKLSRRPPRHRPLAGLLSAVNRTKNCLVRYFNTLVVGRDRSAIVVVPPRSGEGRGRWKGVVLRRNKRNRLMITDGGVRVWRPGSGPVPKAGGGKGGCGGGGGGGGGLWGSGEKEVRWDSMFRDMKPT